MFFVRLVRGRVVGSQISVNNVEQVIFNRLGAINIFRLSSCLSDPSIIGCPSKMIGNHLWSFIV